MADHMKSPRGPRALMRPTGRGLDSTDLAEYGVFSDIKFF